MFQLKEEKLITSSITQESSIFKFFEGNGDLITTLNPMELFPNSVQLFLESAKEYEIEFLLSKQYALRIKLDTDGQKSLICTSVVSISGFIDRNIKEIFDSLIDDLIPCEIMLGEHHHFMAIFKECVKNKNIQPITVDNLLYEKGMFMLGRTSYPNEQNIEKTMQEQGIFIINKSTFFERYNKFKLKWDKQANKDREKQLSTKYTDIVVSAYMSYKNDEKSITTCALSVDTHTYIPKSQYITVISRNEIIGTFLLSRFVEFFSLKEFKDPKDFNVIYYDCNLTLEQVNELLPEAIPADNL